MFESAALQYFSVCSLLYICFIFFHPVNQSTEAANIEMSEQTEDPAVSKGKIVKPKCVPDKPDSQWSYYQNLNMANCNIQISGAAVF